MESPGAKVGVLLSSQRSAISANASSTTWLPLAAFACVLLYMSAYIFAGQRSIGVSRNVLVVIPHQDDRGRIEGGVTAVLKSAEAAPTVEMGDAQELASALDIVDTSEALNEGMNEEASPAAAGTSVGGKGEDEYEDYAYEDTGMDDGDEDYGKDEIRGRENEADVDYESEDGKESILNKLTLRPRTADDETFWNNRVLDPTLNPDVTSEVLLKEGWMDTAFDTLVHTRLEEGKFFLHQTWKTDCVLETRVQYMKTWMEVEPDMLVLFWTDDAMESWVKERFEGTDVKTAWDKLEETRQAKIKKADMFRALAVWFYGGVYADLDVEIKAPIRQFIENEQTVIVWEPESAMEITYADALGGQYVKRRGARKTLMLSAFVVSGRRYADFLGFYINWIVANTLSGRSGEWTHVLDHTGPIAEAEAYYYYTGRLAQHDSLLKVFSYEEFQNYGEHHTIPGESTWDEGKDGGKCVNVHDIYLDRVEVV